MSTIHVRPTVAWLALAAVLLPLAACAPRTTELQAAELRATEVRGDPAAASTEASELRRTALMAFHRMEIVFLETGSYTTNALVDLDLPRGVKWTLEEFDDAGYRLRFTDDQRPEYAWLVSPEGVARVGMPQ